jgi:hypothetical protein
MSSLSPGGRSSRRTGWLFTNNWFNPKGPGIDAVLHAASKKEHDEQVKANGGAIDEIWNHMIRMGRPDQMMFLPPRAPRPPRPAMGGIRPKRRRQLMP